MPYRLLLTAAMVLAACHSPETTTGPSTARRYALQQSRAALPLQELAKAKAAAARYHDVRNAIADGYRDLHVVLPNMGRHFLKDALLDSKFEAARPELLVYTPDSTELLALEYAMPLSDTPPEGFPGNADTWVPFGTLWTLHAWVWKDNPDGVFNPTNARVQ